MRDLLIKQIADEIANGKTDTLNEILVNELNDKQVLGRLTKESLDILEERKPNFELKSGMLIRAKKDLSGVSNSYNTPERIDIPKGVILEIPTQGTDRGDVFCKLIEGKCEKSLRGGSYEGQIKVMTPESNRFEVVGLRQGVNTRYPCDLGLADKNFWEIVK